MPLVCLFVFLGGLLCAAIACLSAAIALHTAMCIRACTACMLALQPCIAKSKQVNKTLANEKIESINGWIKGLATHAVGLKAWKDSKKGLVN